MDVDGGSFDGNDQNVVETTELVGDGSISDPDLPPIGFDGASSSKQPNSLTSSVGLPQGAETALDNFLNGLPRNGPKPEGSSLSFSSAQLHVSSAHPPLAPPQHTITVNIPPPKFLPLPYSTSRSGLVFDVRMRFHEDLFPRQNEEPHPEVPARIASIFNDLMDAGLVPDPARPETDSDHQLRRILIRPATEGEICLVHSRKHLHWVQDLAGLAIDDLNEIGIRLGPLNSIYVHNNTWLCASLAAGGAIEAAKAVVAGQVKNSIALIRPPGHHAEHDHAEGFCFFNNVPIAARVMQLEFPEKCRKILILDWDVHHGNGIQRTFYDDPNVLYISIHVHENGRFYPQGDYGDHLHCGEGPGRGKNVNIPWPTVHMGDAEYIYAFQQIVMPIAVEFDPDLVFISAGFDAADGDPLGACHVTPACYGHMTHMLMQLAKGKVVACLEGGYNLQAIAKSALAMTRVMMGEPPDRMADLTPTRRGVEAIHQVVRTQAKFWKCMYPKDRELNFKRHLESQRMHDIIREWQSGRFWKEHEMIPLFVLRKTLSKSFENQVLATQNYFEARPLLVIFHDPPEAKGYPNPRTNDLELHNTWLTDVSKRYMDWAIQQGFGVIDVNIPKHITQTDDNLQYEESDREEKRAQLTRELASYLWQNYVEMGDSTHVIFLGVGDAYVGITDLLSTHANAFSQVDLTVAFICENKVRFVDRSSDDGSLHRFYKHSLIFVVNDHDAFSGERRLKKKFGRIIQSPHLNLQDMMNEHFDEVTTRILEVTDGWEENEERPVRLAAQIRQQQQERLNENDGVSTNGAVEQTTHKTDPMDMVFTDEL